MSDALAARRAAFPLLYVVGARALFARDGDWLEALERVAVAAAPWHEPQPLQADSGAAAAVGSRIALQVRIETDVDAATLAAAACARLRRANAMLPLYLNAAADAVALGYDGEHWAERRIPAAPLQPQTSAPPVLRAASVHSPAALARATAAGAAFAVFGAVWKPAWKDVPERGLAGLEQLSRHAGIPVLAIGGVTPARVGACKRAGAAGVAVTSGVVGATDVAAAIAAYMTALRDG